MVADTKRSAEALAANIIRCQYPDVDIAEVSLTEFVLAQAAERGDKPAIVDGPSGRTISYGQLPDLVRRVAAGLAAHGFVKGDVLGIYSPNVPEYTIAFHAAASLGGTITTVNPLYTVRELAQQLTDCGAKYLLTVPPFMENAKAAAETMKTVREIFVIGEAEGATPFVSLLTHGDQPPEVSIDPHNDLVALPYSSGTTGMAKGVMLTHHNLVAELSAANGRLDIVFPGEQDTL